MFGSWARVWAIGSLGAVLLLGMSGCATTDGTNEAGNSSGGSGAAASASVPTSSPLSRIEMGMTDLQVRKLLGEADNQSSYMTGKAWIPFYFGGDTHRTDWIYNGVGRVIFSRNRWSGSLTVVNLIHNTSE